MAAAGAVAILPDPEREPLSVTLTAQADRLQRMRTSLDLQKQALQRKRDERGGRVGQALGAVDLNRQAAS